MEREKTQSKQQRKEIPTKQGPYSFFQSQVQGPAGVRPAECKQPILCLWLWTNVWTPDFDEPPNSDPLLPVPMGRRDSQPCPQRLSISSLADMGTPISWVPPSSLCWPQSPLGAGGGMRRGRAK